MRPVQPIEANELFLAMPEAMIAGLRAEGFAFHRWLVPPGETGPVVRMVTSFAMRPEEVDVPVAAATARRSRLLQRSSMKRAKNAKAAALPS